MDEILNSLHSPGWWFTSVFVSILLSLVVGFLKDAVSRGLARSWVWYRKWRAATLSRKEREVEFLSREPAILTLYNNETAAVLMYTLLCLLLSILSLALMHSMFSSTELV